MINFLKFLIKGKVLYASFKYTWLLLYPIIYLIGWFITMNHEWVLIQLKLMLSKQESRSVFVILFLFSWGIKLGIIGIIKDDLKRNNPKH